MSIMSREYLSISIIVGAAKFARDAKLIEDGGQPITNEYLQANRLPHRATVVASIIAATSCLEASINELFCDAGQPNLSTLSSVASHRRELMASMWDIGVPRTARYSILEKYEIALYLVKRRRLDNGRNPAQDVKCLVELRNALIHYEPEWQANVNDSPNTATHIEKRFKSKKIPSNKLTLGNHTPFYPDLLLGHGCAKWSVKVAVSFIDWFCKELGIRPPYDHVRGMLKC
jgi:hypothetical protein